MRFKLRIYRSVPIPALCEMNITTAPYEPGQDIVLRILSTAGSSAPLRPLWGELTVYAVYSPL